MLSEGKISLRSLNIEDKMILAALANNKNIFDNVRDYLPFPYKESDAEEFIQFVQKQNQQTIFAIEYDGRFCGLCGLTLQSDVYRKTAEIGYWLGEPYWNKGIATAAVKLLTQYGFNHFDLVRIHTGVFEYNRASMKVLEKCGYEKDGIFKKSVLKNGIIWDEHRYSKVR
jgi:[ribosomal protein S5]-alanine N-acetyltransferase